MATSSVQGRIAYYKRHRMEVELAGAALPSTPLPAGYRWISWAADLLEVHAEVKYRCFRDEIDGVVFPNLSSRDGCLHLMREISARPGFLADATWLIACGEEHVATVQCVADKRRGCIQNLGVVAEHRGRGLGRALLLRTLQAFRLHGLGRASLEVTESNRAAIRLYRDLGFRNCKTLYRAVESVEANSEIDWCV